MTTAEIIADWEQKLQRSEAKIREINRLFGKPGFEKSAWVTDFANIVAYDLPESSEREKRLIKTLRVAMEEIDLINPGCDALDMIQAILEGKEQTP
jgi:hypothetical protein